MIQASAATDYIATELNKLIQANQINGKLDKSKSSVSIYLRTKDPNNPPPKYFRGSDHHITHASLLLNKWKPWNSINISIEFNEPRYKANGKRKKNVWKQEVFQNEKGTIQPFDVDVYEYTAANLDEPDIPIIFEAIKNFAFTGSYTDPFANNPQKAAKYTHSPALIIPRVSTNISVDKNGNYIRANGDGVDYISENKNINCNRNMNKKLIRLTESDLHRIVKESVNRVLNESDYQVPDNIELEDGEEWWHYDDHNGTEEYEKMLGNTGKMPKGYDEDIPSDMYKYGNTLDRLHFLNEPYPISPMMKKSEIEASWNAIDREYDKKKRRLGSSIDDMDDENYEDYYKKTRNTYTESKIKRIVDESVKRALRCLK